MAVILGLQADDVRAVCAEAQQAVPGEVAEAVNFNEPTQIVIAGHNGAIEKACELAKAKGAKRAMKLAVSAPFHSSLLKPASDRLRDYMAGIAFATPQIDVINNVDVAVYKDPAQIKDALVRQAAGAVRWVETMQKMAADGVTQVIECAPSKTLIGMAKRIDPVLVGDALVDQESLERVLSALNQA
jgi:[acyl-carrier-protein] S-malonyltransferase